MTFIFALKNEKQIYALPINGIVSELGGILSATTIKKTVMLRRVVTPTEVFSPRSAGIRKLKNPTKLLFI